MQKPSLLKNRSLTTASMPPTNPDIGITVCQSSQQMVNFSTFNRGKELTENTADPAAKFELNRGRLDNTDLYATTRIKNWLNACLKHHPQCRLNGIPTLPTRVVDIQTMSLYTSLPREAAQYTALSYCWGGEQPFKTTRKNPNQISTSSLQVRYIRGYHMSTFH